MEVNLNDEIDFVELLKKIYNSKRLVFYFTFCFMALGIITSLILPERYTSSTIFIPQNKDSNSSSLSGVASLVGISLPASNYGGEIPSSMYPQIAESPKFKRLILKEIIDKEKNISLMDFILKRKENDIDIKNDSKIYVSKDEEYCFNIVSKILKININPSDGFISLSTTTGNPKYSAIITNKAKEILQKIIIENKIESARQSLNFSQNQLSEKKMIFDEIQSKLAYFTDSNLNSVNSFVINEKNKLEAEFEIINAVVTELSKQVEQAKLQVKKDTPVFSTIKEATIPNLRSSPKRKQTVIIFSLIGLIFSLSYVLVKEPIIEIWGKIIN